MRKTLFLVVSTILLATAALLPAPAKADTMEWTITNNRSTWILLEFYSQNYSRAWPGGGEAYVLKDGLPHTYLLNCYPGEKICFGAWVNGSGGRTYWGVGRNGREGCTGCCYTCNGDTETTPRTLY